MSIVQEKEELSSAGCCGTLCSARGKQTYCGGIRMTPAFRLLWWGKAWAPHKLINPWLHTPWAEVFHECTLTILLKASIFWVIIHLTFFAPFQLYWDWLYFNEHHVTPMFMWPASILGLWCFFGTRVLPHEGWRFASLGLQNEWDSWLSHLDGWIVSFFCSWFALQLCAAMFPKRALIQPGNWRTCRALWIGY